MMMVRSAVRLFREPKVRHTIAGYSLGVSAVAHQVFVRLVGGGAADGGCKLPSPLESQLSAIETCLVYLRSLLLRDTDRIGDGSSLFAVPSENSSVLLSRSHKNAVSHDKEFLAHVCAFYSQICKSSGFGECARVLLFDLLRQNPNIKGLYFAWAVVAEHPELLQIEYDSHGREAAPVLKHAIHHALQVVCFESARREEIVLHQSAHDIVHRIARCVDELSLAQGDASDLVFCANFATKLWTDHVTPLVTRELATREDDDAVFELCKCLELLATVYSPATTVELFPLDRFQDAFAASVHPNSKAAIVKLVGAIAATLSQAKSTIQTSAKSDGIDDEGSHAFVAKACEWLQALLLDTCEVNVQVACAGVVLDLIWQSAATPDRRCELFVDILRWFQSRSQTQQMLLPAGFLRQLRWIAVSSRPL